MQHLGDWRQAVRGAGGVGDKRFAGVALVVDAHNEHRGVVLGRRRHDHALGAGLDVPFRLGLLEEEARGFANVFRADIAPLERRRVLLRGQADVLAIDHQRVISGLHRAFERPVDAVVLQHVRQLLGIKQIVDAHHFNLRVFHRRAKNQPANAAESIDANLDRHFRISVYYV